MKLKSILFLLPAVLVVSSSFGQYIYKATTGGKKYVLVEEATGPGCGYCPDGAQDIEQSIEVTYPRAIIASWHGAYYDASSMVVTGDPFCGATPYVAGFPAATIDRYVFPGNGGYLGMNRPWDSYVDTRNSSTPNFDVSLECLYLHHVATDTAKADSAMAKIAITVTGKALSNQTGTWNINVFITEDSISSATGYFQQHSYMYSTSYGPACDGDPSWFTGLCASTCGSGCASCAILPAADYSHMNVVRAALATGGSIFGDPAFTNPDSGATFTKIDTFVFDTLLFNPHFMKVIGLVQKPGPASNTAGNTIENAIQMKVRYMPRSVAATGVTEVAKTMTDITLYPNPATSTITVRGTLNEPTTTKIEISNAAGQVVLVKDYAAGGSLFGETIETNNLANGTYLMSIYNGGAKVTKEFIVNR